MKWKKVEGWPSYEVSDTGLVRNTRTHHIKGGWGQKGYNRVGFDDGAKKRNMRVHRLVAEAFLGPPPTPQHQVDHLDGNRQNNAVSNLEWVTCKENIVRGFARGGGSYGATTLTAERVQAIRAAVAAGERLKTVAEKEGLSSSTVWRIAHRKAHRRVA